MSASPPSRWPVAIFALLIGGAIGAAAFWFVSQDSEDEVATEEAVVETTTVAAESRDLISFDEWAATLQSGTSADVSASTRGTVTRNSEVGDQIAFGDVVAEIDGNPVVALYGSVPQFRELDVDADDGADIRQLEANLVALGYDPDGTVTIDDEYSTNTGLMVERWETELGFVEPDTVVANGQVAFIAGPSEVATRTPVGSQVSQGQSLLTTVTLAESGFLELPVEVAAIISLAQAGEPLIDGEAIGEVELAEERFSLIGVAGDANPDRTDAFEVEIPTGAVIAETLFDSAMYVDAGQPIHRWEIPQSGIELEIDVGETDGFPIGLEVDVELPDGEVIPARVDEVGDVARTVQDGQDTITVVDVTIQPLDAIESSFTTGPVTVRVEDSSTLGATVVPVRSLIALAEGGHAVEVDGRGLIAVELGAFDEGWVEVTNGTIDPGEMLVVPR